MKYLPMIFGLYTLWVIPALAAFHPAPHAIHEARESLPPNWVKRSDQLNSQFKLPIRVGLTQSNLHKGYGLLMDVSSPHSSNYGKHYSKEEVTELFAPSNKTFIAVKTWLVESGIDESRISRSRGRNWLKFEATIAEAEGLLRTKYNVYEHDSGATHIGCDSYQVPKHIQDHVDFIVPTLHIDAHVENRGPSQKRDMSSNQETGNKRHGPMPIVKPGAVIPDLTEMLKSKPNRTALCNILIFPECLQALYKIPIPTKMNPKNSFG